MQSISIPVPTLEPEQVLEIAVSIGGEADSDGAVQTGDRSIFQT